MLKCFSIFIRYLGGLSVNVTRRFVQIFEQQRCLWETQQLRHLREFSVFSKVCLLCNLDHRKQTCRPCHDHRWHYAKARFRCMASARHICSAQSGTVTGFFIISGSPCQYRSTDVLYSSSSSIYFDQKDKKEEDWEPWNKSVLFGYREALHSKRTAHRSLVGQLEGKRWFWIPRLWEYITDFDL
jgi:hypothetical protein